MSDVNFSDLFQERLTINNLPDGSSLTLINRDEMGLEDFAEFQALQRRIEKLTKAVQGANNQQAALKSAKEMDDAINEGLRRLAVGEIADSTLAALKLGQKGSIVEYWGKHQSNLAAKNG